MSAVSKADAEQGLGCGTSTCLLGPDVSRPTVRLGWPTPPTSPIPSPFSKEQRGAYLTATRHSSGSSSGPVSSTTVPSLTYPHHTTQHIKSYLEAQLLLSSDRSLWNFLEKGSYAKSEELTSTRFPHSFQRGACTEHANAQLIGIARARYS